MKQILVFRTSVGHVNEIEILSPMLDRLVLPDGEWNFDLEDCDNILRVESITSVSEAIQNLLAGWGYLCEELPD